MFGLNNLKKIIKRRKIVGRGEGSNRGKNSGKGHKGQTKRGHVRIGFEGGQKPLIRRLPKVRGFKNYDRKNKLTLTLTAIDKAYSKGEEVSLTTLLEKGLITNLIKKVRIINTGTLSNKLTFKEEEGLYLTKGVKGII